MIAVLAGNHEQARRFLRENPRAVYIHDAGTVRGYTITRLVLIGTYYDRDPELLLAARQAMPPGSEVERLA